MLDFTFVYKGFIDFGVCQNSPPFCPKKHNPYTKRIYNFLSELPGKKTAESWFHSHSKRQGFLPRIEHEKLWGRALSLLAKSDVSHVEAIGNRWLESEARPIGAAARKIGLQLTG